MEVSTQARDSWYGVICRRGEPKILSSKAHHIGKSKGTFISAPTIAYSYRCILLS
jgi:hypothetical protein